jgi:hypothetical protein
MEDPLSHEVGCFDLPTKRAPITLSFGRPLLVTFFANVIPVLHFDL